MPPTLWGHKNDHDNKGVGVEQLHHEQLEKQDNFDGNDECFLRYVNGDT
jgi:hypothetical protein